MNLISPKVVIIINLLNHSLGMNFLENYYLQYPLYPFGEAC